jgi:hypothetical protein
VSLGPTEERQNVAECESALRQTCGPWIAIECAIDRAKHCGYPWGDVKGSENLSPWCRANKNANSNADYSYSKGKKCGWLWVVGCRFWARLQLRAFNFRASAMEL